MTCPDAEMALDRIEKMPVTGEPNCRITVHALTLLQAFPRYRNLRNIRMRFANHAARILPQMIEGGTFAPTGQHDQCCREASEKPLAVHVVPRVAGAF
jgi:hypothetical protein